eukprot:6195794-Pleurochrysis_carterae.AAC.4
MPVVFAGALLLFAPRSSSAERVSVATLQWKQAPKSSGFCCPTLHRLRSYLRVTLGVGCALQFGTIFSETKTLNSGSGTCRSANTFQIQTSQVRMAHNSHVFLCPRANSAGKGRQTVRRSKRSCRHCV